MLDCDIQIPGKIWGFSKSFFLFLVATQTALVEARITSPFWKRAYFKIAKCHTNIESIYSVKLLSYD